MANTDLDTDLQALLDPSDGRREIRIIRRVDASATIEAFYVQLGASSSNNPGGKAMWVNCTKSDADAQKVTAIKAALGVP